MFPCQALPPGPAREDAFNPHPSPKPGSVEERISVKEGGLPLPLANGATADNLVDKCNRSASLILQRWFRKFAKFYNTRKRCLCLLVRHFYCLNTTAKFKLYMGLVISKC